MLCPLGSREAMRRRFRTGGETIKMRSRKTATLKRRNGAKAAPRRKSSATGQKTIIMQLTRELKEVLEQQAAPSEVLHVISSSPGELKPVFETMLSNATRICEAQFG